MGSFSLVSIIFMIYLFTLYNLQYTTVVQAEEYRYHSCDGSNYTSNSTFQTNLNLLLPLLSSADTSTIINGYYNNTVGRNLDTIYGSFQCRGDVSLEDCQGCVQKGAERINKVIGCPNSKKAIIWYDICMLRYSNQYYFNIMQDEPAMFLMNTNKISNPDLFKPTLNAFLNRLVKESQIIAGSPKYLSGDTDFKETSTNTTKLYGYVQCTEDMSYGDCNQCLRGAISDLPNCCDGKQGGQVLKPSCILRFELYPLFQSIITPPPPQLPTPAPRLSPPSTTKPGSTNTTPPV
ncbi:hypothetical protein MKX03_019379, partial [Papaver bracteatum]